MRYDGSCYLIYIVGILLSATGQNSIAQLPVYNSNFILARSIQTKGELGDSLRIMGIVDRTYNIQGTKVIEYYEMSTAMFLGFAGDTTQFNVSRLPYLSRTATMRRLVKQFGPATAHDIRQGLFIPGILQQDIFALYGWPKKRKREDGKMLWIYDDVTLVFTRQVLTEFMKQGS